MSQTTKKWENIFRKGSGYRVFDYLGIVILPGGSRGL
jgi:hypothetical protein